MQPKVFISHASEDKARFVEKFAERLRQQGIDAWLDKWEMLPGDSLVDKIFEEGIKDADAIVVVLSKFSISKPWVREELNAAFVKRINTGSKLIPIVLDDCEVPQSLKSTLWESIGNLSSYDSNFDRVVSAIFGTSDKPPLGPVPKHIEQLSESIGDLTKMDSYVLRLSCEELLQSRDQMVNPTRVFVKDGELIIPEQELRDSLEMLEKSGCIELMRNIGRGLFPYQVTTYGFEIYAESEIEDYEETISSVISAIVNQNLKTNVEIAQSVRTNSKVIDHVLDVFELNGHVKMSRMVGGLVQIYEVSPSLRRMIAS